MRETTETARDGFKYLRSGCAVATIAAVVATVGDLLMLYVANAGRPELGLAAMPAPVLWIGGMLGVVAIPIYVLGYRAAATLAAPRFARHARVVAVAGAAGSVLGAVIHGCTAFFIREGLASGAPAEDPLAAVAGSPLLLTLWGAATLLVISASVAFAIALRRGVPSAPRGLAWANPAVVTIALSLAGSVTPMSRAFLVPAAPNLAHVVFFAACARAMKLEMARRP
jgi:hypothetical protein